MPNNLGTDERALRVAIIGSGPSAFYAAESLFKSGKNIVVNMFERLPAPYGLVRYGVAPDHAKIKNVTKVYDKTAEHAGYEYFGNVTFGKDINLHELRKFHDAVIFANGADSDRRLGIQGEDLLGSHTATEFVAWYNGHPLFQDRIFDLSNEVAVVIGQGNVAVDVCRILCKTVDELKNTDISKKALDVLSTSKIREVHMIGRRGPVQAAFTPVEIREFGELADCAPVVDKKDLEINYSSQVELEDPKNAPKRKNFEILKSLSEMDPGNKRKRFFIHFRKSPVALGGAKRLEKVFLERNELVGEPGKQKSRGTGEKEVIVSGLLFRSVGYRGRPLDGVPFNEAWGTIANEHGRVADSEHIFSGLYTSGWIKRGPSGIIGTNKPDSEETVKLLMDDMGSLNPCKDPHTKSLKTLLEKKGVRYISFADWKKIDAAEIANGEKVGKPREKFTNTEDMLKVLK